jgi:hypothetical protein
MLGNRKIEQNQGDPMSVPVPDRLEHFRAHLAAQQPHADDEPRANTPVLTPDDLAWAVREIESLRELRTSPLAADELEDVAIRHQTASPGPWTRAGDVIVDAYTHPVALTGHTAFPARDPQVWHRKDAEFIAQAWEDVGRLLTEVRRLRAEFGSNG